MKDFYCGMLPLGNSATSHLLEMSAQKKRSTNHKSWNDRFTSKKIMQLLVSNEDFHNEHLINEIPNMFLCREDCVDWF